MYDATRLDMDIEGRSLNRPAGIDRRNNALKLVQDWITEQGRTLQVSYTPPTSASGLEPSGLAVLQNAIANGTRVDVDIMTFDYYDRVTTDMGGAAISAAQGLHAQLQTLYAGKTSAELWAMVGICDNGGCPGQTGSNDCSGVVQSTWDFTHVLQPFTAP
jgi:hypothetical protein